MQLNNDLFAGCLTASVTTMLYIVLYVFLFLFFRLCFVSSLPYDNAGQLVFCFKFASRLPGRSPDSGILRTDLHK